MNPSISHYEKKRYFNYTQILFNVYIMELQIRLNSVYIFREKTVIFLPKQVCFEKETFNNKNM